MDHLQGMNEYQRATFQELKMIYGPVKFTNMVSGGWAKITIGQRHFRIAYIDDTGTYKTGR